MADALPSTEVLIIYFFILGSIFGSFANVVILRLPKKKSIVFPASHCPKCKKPIQWFHNIPIFSWFALRGRCASCRKPISFRYPLIEFITGLLFALIFWRVGWSWSLLEYLIFAWSLVVVSFIDFDLMILPDVFTLSGIVIGLLGAALNPERQLLPAALGVLVGGGFLWAVAYFYVLLRKEEGMGGGDIKLLAWIGAVLGWTSVPFVILVSSIIGSIAGLAVAIQSKKGLKSSIPFGPYLALAAILFILGGEKLGLWYIHLFLPALTPMN